MEAQASFKTWSLLFASMAALSLGCGESSNGDGSGATGGSGGMAGSAGTGGAAGTGGSAGAGGMAGTGGSSFPLVFSDFQGAALVVGQADFLGTAPDQGRSAGANTLHSPFGAPVVAEGQLFVADSANHRVLGFLALPTVNDASADFVLGQPDFRTTTPNTTRGGMNRPWSVATAEGKLIVVDFGNNRLLIYDAIPTDGSALPAVVVGQPDFEAAELGCTADRLVGPAAASVTPTGKLIVTDSSHNRVLIWNALPTTDGQPADLVLGQSDMVHCASNDDNQDGTDDGAPTARTLHGPIGAWADDGQLVVADYVNHRVLIWSPFPTVSFEQASLVLGQSSFDKRVRNDDDQDGNVDAGPTARTLNLPAFVHSAGGQLVVTDSSNHRTLIWTAFPTLSFQPADVVLGQSSFIRNASNDDNQDGVPDANASARTQNLTTGALYHQEKLLVTDFGNSRLLIYSSQ